MTPLARGRLGRGHRFRERIVRAAGDGTMDRGFPRFDRGEERVGAAHPVERIEAAIEKIVPAGMPAGRKTFSTLSIVLGDPPVVETPPVKTFPRYTFPPTLTVRSRLLTRAGLPVPGGSVQTSVTRTGFVESATVPI